MWLSEEQVEDLSTCSELIEEDLKIWGFSEGVVDFVRLQYGVSQLIVFFIVFTYVLCEGRDLANDLGLFTDNDGLRFCIVGPLIFPVSFLLGAISGAWAGRLVAILLGTIIGLISGLLFLFGILDGKFSRVLASIRVWQWLWRRGWKQIYNRIIILPPPLWVATCVGSLVGSVSSLICPLEGVAWLATISWYISTIGLFFTWDRIKRWARLKFKREKSPKEKDSQAQTTRAWRLSPPVIPSKADKVRVSSKGVEQEGNKVIEDSSKKSRSRNSEADTISLRMISVEELNSKIVALQKSIQKEALLSKLRENGIKYLYHFTANENYAKIKARGGLYSWAKLEKEGWNIPVAGGSTLSRTLDVKKGLQDYVRLSFCSSHPMAYRLRKEGHSLVLLYIDIEAVTLDGVKFSDRNATANGVLVAGGMEGLQLVKLPATQRSFVSKDDPDFPYLQAEILIPNHLPSKYIKKVENMR